MLNELKSLRIDDFDYPLPEGRIARYPAAQRDRSKLLCLEGDTISEHVFRELPSLLPTGSMLVFNDTRVIHARLLFRKESGASIEVFCLEPHGMAISEAFEQRERCEWVCMIGNNKKWKSGTLKLDCPGLDSPCTLIAAKLEPFGSNWIVEFSWNGGASFAEVIDKAGVIPLPPYMNRQAEASDAERYQTVYAHHDGSVAAPTAGLHFTPEVLKELSSKGIPTEYITLHVGAGTFKPVSTDTIGEHEMHVEQVQATIENLQHIAMHNGPLVAVGTTSVRTLESIYWFGVQLEETPDLGVIHIDQWMPYNPHPKISKTQAYTNVIKWLERNRLDRLEGETQLMIAPGYTYKIVDALVTNFHQPRSTLLLLVSALIGDRWKEAYRYALNHDFRFLSYGDSCLFIPR